MSWIILLWRDLGSKLFHTTFVFYYGGIVMALTFQERLSSAFGNASMAEIARRINAPHATVRNYFQGRMPAPEVLIKIANETNVSLNWLLLGTGEMFAAGAVPVDIGKAIDERIE